MERGALTSTLNWRSVAFSRHVAQVRFSKTCKPYELDTYRWRYSWFHQCVSCNPLGIWDACGVKLTDVSLRSSRPGFAARSYTIGTTFPNRTLDDDTLTIDKAGLANSVIVMRWT